MDPADRIVPDLSTLQWQSNSHDFRIGNDFIYMSNARFFHYYYYCSMFLYNAMFFVCFIVS